MHKLRVLPLALGAGLLLPAVPAFASPVYASQGSTTYFAAVSASPLTSISVAPSYAPPDTNSGGSSQSEQSPPQTASTFSTGSMSYFVPGLGQWTVETVPASAEPSSAASGGTSSPSQSASTSAPTTSASAGPASGSSTSLSGQFLSLVNQARQQAGLGALADSPVLDQLALAKAQDMITYGYVAHYSPRLGWPVNQETAAGFSAQSMGAENIAEAGTIQRAMIDLMSDPGHKANLLDPAFTQTGIAVLPVTGGVLVEELFAGPSF